ncbi:hypothetical protein L227DRAFT_496300 [Lentinus tigrinus ALCF2SS1-6]|uniref:MULE transposase domain-containing protein n=1 Tax=Lentinus tigrinus ALCF2SS1-6 TaxID=1328759 RepID=A0A5C2SJC4_9APHY|nr:hypothetical protein L227DRAFT_496300 [Lentinus tigrinus ALCF2SS1-6]
MLIIASYVAHDFDLPDPLSEFMVGLTDNFSLDSLILNGALRGWGMDSSWRNKNENRAAVTFLMTVNSGLHAVPGSVLLSANTRHETLAKFLQETWERIRLRAQAILSARTAEEESELRQLADDIVKDKYKISHFMIDKCLAELHAIKQAVFPSAYIRLCQFHIIQALTRLDCDNGDRGAPMRISLDIKYQIVYHFRTMQRCRTWKEWPEARNVFLKYLEDVERCRKQLDYLRQYFITNWFTEDWIPLFTDIGMPSDQTRDGPWNTNNWLERAFRTFDAVFLEHRANKRIDRLAVIILNDFLPFYRIWQPEDQAHNRAILDLNHQAYLMWTNNLVTPMDSSDVTKKTIFRVVSPAYVPCPLRIGNS